MTDATIANLIDQARSSLQLGNVAAAMALYQQAADRARLCGEDGPLAYCLRHISALAYDHNNGEVALQAGREAVTIYRDRLEDSLGLANALRVTALAHAALGEPDQAAPCWVEARAIYQQLDIADGVAEADRWLAITPQQPPPALP